MFTKAEEVTGIVAIWAVPYNQWHMEANPESRPFFYDIRTTDSWTQGAVKVCEHSVTVPVPEGINLIAEAVATLEARKKKVQETYVAEIQELDLRIRGLLQLTHIPEEVV